MAEVTVGIITNENDNNCSFFLPKKNRHCRMKTMTGNKYCPQHAHLCPEQISNKGIRIPCPLDPSHTCYLSKLEQHKKKCNAREKDKPPYYQQSINFGTPSDASAKLGVADTSDEELMICIEKIERAYKDNMSELKQHNSWHPMLQDEMEKSESGIYSRKHLQQQASLLALMEKYHLMSGGNCFVEFGAGKGQLMYWIIVAQQDRKNKSYVLVDKSAQRYKFDNKFKQNDDIKVERIRIDIEHLYLVHGRALFKEVFRIVISEKSGYASTKVTGKVESVKSQLSQTVGVSKHLCGSATDLALRCMFETLTSDVKGNLVHNVPLGLVMSLCCHHRCTWETYVGKEFMESNGFSQREFQLMCSMASWATCGLRKTAQNPEDKCFDNNEDEPLIENKINRYIKLGLSHAQREEIGMKCKRFIDMGRVSYVEKCGLTSELIIYVDRSVSLENVALIGLAKTI